MAGRRQFLAGGAALLATPKVAKAQGTSVLKFVPAADLSVLDPVWTTSYQNSRSRFSGFRHAVWSRQRISAVAANGRGCDDRGWW